MLMKDRCVAITGKGTLCTRSATYGPYCGIHKQKLVTIEEVLHSILELVAR